MEVPLANCCGGRSALDAGADSQGPEIDKDEEEAKEPSAGIYDEQVFCIGEVATKEDTGEHGHPDPGPGDNTQEGRKTDEEQARICGKDAAGEFENADGFAEGVAAAVENEGPDDG